jgi:glycine/D-amino acid oxidase-like deaminating enzyme
LFFLLVIIYSHMTMVHNVAVVGAGVVGLSTAVQIQQMTSNNVAVTIIADKFTTDTTSHGAAGIFRPTLSKTPGVPVTLLRFVLKLNLLTCILMTVAVNTVCCQMIRSLLSL